MIYLESWIALYNVVGTKQAMSTVFHPQTDGQTKRVNKIPDLGQLTN